MDNKPAIVVLGASALPTARRIQAIYSGSRVYGLSSRVVDVDQSFDNFGETVRELYRTDTPIIALCAAGIVIRSLASVLSEKGSEPPVLAVAEDASAVVPLLGGLGGVNRMAREIAESLDTRAAITTSGELRFGTCLLDPPPGYVLADLQHGKRFVSDLLGGEAVRVQGTAPWLDAAQLPIDGGAQRVIHVDPAARPQRDDELLIHPKQVMAWVGQAGPQLAEEIIDAMHQANLALPALACLAAGMDLMAEPLLHEAAATLRVPVRFVDDMTGLPAVPHRNATVQLLLGDQPIDPLAIGQPRGRLTVIGLGPGAANMLIPAARQALDEAQDLLGYETYVNMAGPFRDDQIIHCTDNREEMQRSRHAFELAASGRRVVVISSGDPGVFAMAAAVLEALHESSDPRWQSVDLQILPGVSAALATAAKAGAPLGHDFCLLSLSDNLKPWAVIEKRLHHAAAADLVMAFYNPISRARPWQLGRALDLIRLQRSSDTLVVLGRDIGRPAEKLTVTTLGALQPEQVDMRTLVIIGSSQTCQFDKQGGETWVYTPRWYPAE